MPEKINPALQMSLNGFTAFADRLLRTVKRDPQTPLTQSQMDELEKYLDDLKTGFTTDVQFFHELLTNLATKLNTINGGFVGVEHAKREMSLLEGAKKSIDDKRRRTGFDQEIKSLAGQMTVPPATTGNPVADLLTCQEIRTKISGKEEPEIYKMYMSECEDPNSDGWLVRAVMTAPSSFPLLKPEWIQQGQEIQREKKYPLTAIKLEALEAQQEEFDLLITRAEQQLQTLGWSVEALKHLDQAKAEKKADAIRQAQAQNEFNKRQQAL